MHSGGPHAPSSSFQAMSTLTDKPTDLFSPLSCQENSTSAAAHQLQVVRNVPACNGSVESLSIVMQTQTPLPVGQRDSVSQKSPSQTSQLRVKVYQPGTTYKSPTAQVPYLPPPPLRTSPSSSSSTLVAPPAAPVTPQPPPSQSFAHRKRSAFCQNSNSDYGRPCVPPVTSSGTTDVKRKMSEECSYALKEDNHFLNMEPDVENQNDAVRVKFLQKQGFEGERPRCRWTNREKYLLSISCILFVACIAFVVVAYTRDMQQNVHHYGYCLSAKCVNTAAQLMAAMDTSADPCQDFFQYACGQWNKHNVIPEDKHSYNTFEKLHDELQIVLKSLLEEDVHQYDSNSTIKAKTLYNSCLNLTQINIIGDQPLRTVTAQLGGWPIITPNWDKSSFVLEDILADIRLTYNAAILIGSWVGADDKNSTSNIIQLDQPGLGMPSREYYLKGKSESEYVQAYLNFMRGVVRLLGAQDNVTVERQLDELLDFETKLANVTKPQAERHDTGALYNKMTIRQLQDLVPQLNWLRYLNRAVSPILTLDEEIVVFAIEYLQDMTTIIQQTDSRTIANYLVWRVVMMLTPELTENYQEVNSKYKMVLHGVKRDKLRWKKCVEYANDQMGLAVGAMFVRENFRWQSKQTAMEMIRDIREAFNELLDENVWMDEATKSVAREKANAMNARIGYPDFITDREQLDEKYKELSFDEEHYFNNVLTMKRYEAQRTMLRLGKSVDKDLWEQEPAVVNAFYNPNSNDIVFPAGILQPLFYSEHFPKSLNYGGIGVVIGHEITHGFDDKGRQYDLEGNLKQWWDNQTIEAFRERAQCIVDQYSGFKLEQTGLFVNGKNTQGENIADNGGLKQAYRAYQKWVTSHGEEAKLPGVGLSHDQLFFLNYAQIWCGKMRDEEALHGIRTSVHSPGPIRVLGPLSNSVDFARAYGCPLGSRMNPERKCSVW